MFVYTGSNPVTKRLIEELNSANARGNRIEVPYIRNFNTFPSWSSYQDLNILAYRQDRGDNTRRISYESRSPKGGRTHKEFLRLQKQKAVVTSEYHRERTTLTVSFEPNDLDPEGRIHVGSDFDSLAVSYNGKDYDWYGPVYYEGTGHLNTDQVPWEHKVLGFDPGVYGYRPFTNERWTSSVTGPHQRKVSGDIYLYPVHQVQDFIPDLRVGSVPMIKSYAPTPPEATLECVKRLRASQADMLTAIAEMRSTVEGIVSNAARLVQWIKRLQTMASLKRNLASGPDPFSKMGWTLNEKHRLHVGARRNYERERRKAERRYQRFKTANARKYGNDTAKGAIDRLTSHWLDAQYGIQPTVLTIVDLLKLLEKQRGDFQRASVRYDLRHRVPENEYGWTLVSSNVKISSKVWGKSRLDFDRLIDDVLSYTNANPILTAWELIPLSFVLDWVYKVGDMLSTLMKPGVGIHEVYMDIRAQEITATYERIEPSGKYKLRVETFSFTRSYMDIDERFLITPHWDLNWQNYITAMSLIWAKARGTKIPKGSLT